MQQQSKVCEKSFIKVFRGQPRMARVRLEYVPNSTLASFDIQLGNVVETDPEWTAAVISGVQKGIEYFHTIGIGGEYGNIIVEAIIGNLLDTTPDALECAAFVVLCDLLIPQHPLPPLSATPPWRFLFN